MPDEIRFPARRAAEAAPAVPHCLVWANLEGGRRYELWRTPEVRPGWHLYAYQDGAEIARLPVADERDGRIEFERRVSAYVESSD